MPSQSINTEIIELLDATTQSTLSKSICLTVHEMIEYFSGVIYNILLRGTLQCFAIEGMQW